MIANLPDDQGNRIVAGAIELMSGITDAYGPEAGYKVWDAVFEAMGQEVKDAIFIAMLTGQTSNKIRIHGLKGFPVLNKVECIKVYRTYTGKGLKESKDAIDSVFNGADTLMDVVFSKRTEACKDLRLVGLTVS